MPSGSPSKRTQILCVALATVVGLAFGALGWKSQNWIGLEAYVSFWAFKALFALFKIGIQVAVDWKERKARLEWRRRQAQGG